MALLREGVSRGKTQHTMRVARGARRKIIAHVLYEGVYGLWPVSSVSVWLLGGLSNLLVTFTATVTGVVQES